MGFSGEDLQYDRNYLMIRPSVIEGARFQFLVRAERPSVPLDNLRNAFPDRVLLNRGELPGWLFDVVSAANIGHSIALSVNYSEQQIKEISIACHAELGERVESMAVVAESNGGYQRGDRPLVISRAAHCGRSSTGAHVEFLSRER